MENGIASKLFWGYYCEQPNSLRNTQAELRMEIGKECSRDYNTNINQLNLNVSLGIMLNLIQPHNSKFETRFCLAVLKMNC